MPALSLVCALPVQMLSTVPGSLPSALASSFILAELHLPLVVVNDAMYAAFAEFPSASAPTRAATPRAAFGPNLMTLLLVLLAVRGFFRSAPLPSDLKRALCEIIVSV